MNIQQDFKELLALLEKHKVDYMVVGGYAVAFHGYPRFTKDIDIFFELSNSNISSIVDALVDFGFTRESLKELLFDEDDNIVTFGVAPVRVDFINSIDGVNFADAKKSRVRGRYGDVDIFFIGREHLLKNKASTNRLKDKADLEELVSVDDV